MNKTWMKIFVGDAEESANSMLLSIYNHLNKMITDIRLINMHKQDVFLPYVVKSRFKAIYINDDVIQQTLCTMCKALVIETIF